MKILVLCLFVSITHVVGESPEENTMHTATKKSVNTTAHYDACVSLLVYKDQSCKGVPIRSLTFPTSTKTTGPCVHDATMVGYSVKDQHCDLRHGSFKQKVYIFSSTWHVPWYTELFSPQEQVFRTDKCSNGLKVDYCNQGSCPTETDLDFMELMNRTRQSLRFRIPYNVE